MKLSFKRVVTAAAMALAVAIGLAACGGNPAPPRPIAPQGIQLLGSRPTCFTPVTDPRERAILQAQVGIQHTLFASNESCVINPYKGVFAQQVYNAADKYVDYPLYAVMADIERDLALYGSLDGILTPAEIVTLSHLIVFDDSGNYYPLYVQNGNSWARPNYYTNPRGRVGYTGYGSTVNTYSPQASAPRGYTPYTAPATTAPSGTVTDGVAKAASPKASATPKPTTPPTSAPKAAAPSTTSSKVCKTDPITKKTVCK